MELLGGEKGHSHGRNSEQQCLLKKLDCHVEFWLRKMKNGNFGGSCNNPGVDKVKIRTKTAGELGERIKGGSYPR